MAVRNADETAVPPITPSVIGTGQDLGAAALPVDQARAAVPADVGECTRLAVVAADDDDALAQIVEAAPLARLGDVAVMAHDLGRGAEECLLLRREEFGIVIQPAGQAHPVQWINGLANWAEMRCHGFRLAIWLALRQWARRWGAGWSRAPVFRSLPSPGRAAREEF